MALSMRQKSSSHLLEGTGLVSNKTRVDHARCSHAKRKKKHAAGLLVAVCVFLSLLLLISERQGGGFIAMATALRLPLLLRSRSKTVSSLLSRRRFSAVCRLGDEKMRLSSSRSATTSSSSSSSTTALNAAKFGGPLVTVEEVRWGCVRGSRRSAHFSRGTVERDYAVMLLQRGMQTEAVALSAADVRR